MSLNMEKIEDGWLSMISADLDIPAPILDLSNLTIVIPTYERPEYLLRQIAYLSKWKVRVEIVDGSRQPLEGRIIELLAKFPHINYRNFQASYTDRVFFACEKIDTPYAMCLADDDFYLQSGLASAIKQLESNQNAVACMGQSLGFDCFDDGYYYFLYGSNLCNYANNSIFMGERIVNGMREYRAATSYAVFRAQAFMKVWAKREHMSCLEAVEYEHAIRTYLGGGLITTSATYWLRSFETQPVPSALDGNRAIDFTMWYHDSRFNQEKEAFKRRMLQIFMSEGALSELEARELYESAVLLILAKSHSSLSDKNISIALAERLLNIVNAVSSGGFRKLKRTYPWQAVRATVFYFTRKKVMEREGSGAEEKGELCKVLEFANRFGPCAIK